MTEEEAKRQKELWKQDRIKARAEEWEKIRHLGGMARIRYLWDYYKFVLVILIIVIFTGSVIATMITGARTENVLYTCIINVDELDTDDERLLEDFISYIGGIGKRQEIEFDTSIRIDPNASGTSQLDVANTMKMTALLQSAILDACLAPADATEFMQEQGMLLELDDLLDRDRKAEYSAGGYLYYAPAPVFDEETGLLLSEETESGTETGEDDSDSAQEDREQFIYAVRIDQAGVLERYGIHVGNEIWFSVTGNSKHLENDIKLLDFLLDESG